MIAKVCVALLTLYLALAPGCSSDGGGGGKSPAAGQSAPPQQAATANVSATPVPPRPEGSAATAGGGEACRLLTSEDIQAVQGEAVREARGSEEKAGPLINAQCFYTTPTYNKSVVVTLTQRNPASAEAGGPKEFWKRQFGGDAGREKRRGEKKEERDRGEGSEGEGEKERPAEPIKGIGDEAYWVGNQKVGALYVLKGDRFLRISIGGPEEQQVKIDRMKVLAKRALRRL